MTSQLIINEIADGIQSFTYNIYPNDPEVLQNLHKCANNFKRIYIVNMGNYKYITSNAVVGKMFTKIKFKDHIVSLDNIIKIKKIDNDLTFCEFLTKIIYSQ